MATVETVLSGYSLIMFRDSIIDVKTIRHYTGNGQSESTNKSTSDDLDSQVKSGTVILGGAEPDIVAITLTDLKTIII